MPAIITMGTDAQALVFYFFVMQQYSDAKYYYEKACNLNSGLRCSSLGVLYYYGYGVKQDRDSEQANRILALLGDKYQKTYGG